MTRKTNRHRFIDLVILFLVVRFAFAVLIAFSLGVIVIVSGMICTGSKSFEHVGDSGINADDSPLLVPVAQYDLLLPQQFVLTRIGHIVKLLLHLAAIPVVVNPFNKPDGDKRQHHADETDQQYDRNIDVIIARPFATMTMVTTVRNGGWVSGGRFGFCRSAHIFITVIYGLS